MNHSELNFLMPLFYHKDVIWLTMNLFQERENLYREVEDEALTKNSAAGEAQSGSKNRKR